MNNQERAIARRLALLLLLSGAHSVGTRACIGIVLLVACLQSWE